MPSSPEAIERNRQRAKERYWKIKAMRDADPVFDEEFRARRRANDRRYRRLNYKRESERRKAYYLANRERLLEYNKQYRQTHKEQLAEYRRQYRSR